MPEFPDLPSIDLTRVKASTGATIFETQIVFATEDAKQQFIAYLAGQLPAGSKIARWVDPPTSKTSEGAPGMMAQDADYFYTYLGDGETHEWGRIPIVREW